MYKNIRNLVVFILFLGMIHVYAEEYDAQIADCTNLIPSVPQVGQKALFTTKISPVYKNTKIFVFFRSHEDSFSLPLQDDGTNGDEKEKDDIFSCIFPAQSKSGLWYCLVGAQDKDDNMKYSLPQVFLITDSATEYRGIWADSWNDGFLTKVQTANLVNTVREANLNTIIPEVRKIGDAYYNSTYEPRANNIPDPDYDPLKHMIDLAHDTSGGKKRIEVHAWIVNYRIFKSRRGNSDFPAKHILAKHPEWASIDSKGKKTDNGAYYLDPGVPAVTDYNIDICLDIIKKYDVDGINFDYIRYPGMGWGYNPIALERFRKLYNRKDTPSIKDPQWLSFQREQVTHFLRKAYVKMIAVKPQIKVSVCTIGWGDIRNGNFQRTDAYAGGIQDWAEWNRQHILDINFRMGYKRQAIDKQKAQFQNWAQFTLGGQCFRLSTIGIGSYLNSFNESLEQIKTARMFGSKGFVLYCYNSPSKDKESPPAFFKKLRNEALSEWCDVPPLAWKISGPNGILAGTILENKIPLDGGEVYLPEINLKTKTDGTGFYAFMDVPTGNYRVEINGKNAGSIESKAGNITEFNVQIP